MSATAVKVTRKDFVALCNEVGMVNVRDDSNWPNARLLMKAKKLPSLLGESEPEISKGSLELLNQITEALKDGCDIEFEGAIGGKEKKFVKPEKAEANGKPEKEKVEKPSKEKKPKEKKEPDLTKVDRYGCRLGNDTAKVNAFLKEKPQTAEKIAEKAKEKGLEIKNFGPSWVKAHYRYLAKKGAPIVESEDGFACKPE